MRILIAGGGSGGHVHPGLAVATALRQQETRVELHWLGSKGGIEEGLVAAAGIPFTPIHAGKLNRFASLQTLRDLARVPVGLLDAVAAVSRLRPDAALTCGGFVAAPAGAAMWLTGRPLLALQQDIEPNLANRLISPFAQKVGVAFAASIGFFPPGKAIVTGNPVRPDLFEATAAQGRRMFGLPETFPVVLVTGGSQGALSLNRLVLARLGRWLERASVIHLCGARSVAMVETAAAALPESLRSRYAWRSFVTYEMGAALAAADVVVCRAGAATLAELAALGKAAILVPLPPPVGRSPQEANAQALANAGAAIALPERTASPDLLLAHVCALLDDPMQRQYLASRLAALGHPSAAEDIARLLMRLACLPT